MLSLWEAMLRLVGALACGYVIGLERRSEGKPTGPRTQMLVSMGSCLFMLTVELMPMQGVAWDPSRIAAGVITGVGFLGAGSIIRDRGSVVGLTSAASIWMTAAIGVALGAGSYVIALAATLLTVLVLSGWIPGTRHPIWRIRRAGHADDDAKSRD